MKNHFLKFAWCATLMLAAESSSGQFIRNTGIEVTNTTELTATGAWTNDAGTVLHNNGLIIVRESFTNDGILDEGSTGGFRLEFSSDMNFRPGAPVLPYLVKKGAGAAVLLATLRIRDSLMLQQGKVRFANGSDTLGILSGAVVISNASSFVEGLIARYGNGTLFFPSGRDNYYLPLHIFNAQATRVTASVIDAPAGTAGAGVEAMIAFPYAWKVDEKLASDTAGYVGIEYSAALPTATNPILVKLGAGNVYRSMGARAISADSIVRIKSYSRALKGIFTVAKGFPVDPVTDSLALVALYTHTNGTTWLTKTNWTSGPVDTWHGISRSGQTITSIALPGNNLSGAVPVELADIVGVQVIDLSDNNLNQIPNFSSNSNLTSLDVSGNQLTFASLEPNASVTGFNYMDQEPFGDAVDTLVAVGQPYLFSVNAGGANTIYQWKKGETAVEGATTSTYQLNAIDRTNMGAYVAEATNPLLPGLVLESATQQALAYAKVSGTLFAEANVPASLGAMTLFRVTTGAYDTIQIRAISDDGSFTFDKIVLDDYQLLGFADTLVHERAIPTYYQNTIFWEEADTLTVESNIPDLNIVSNREPAPPSGQGVISGYLEEDDGSGRTNDPAAPKRVAGAGVTARRVEHTGRGKEEVLTLVSYAFTNDNGEFSLANLPQGEYRINIQYPGYPMDTTSFITIPIGGGLQSMVQVEATVSGEQIAVRKLNITGIYQAEGYHAELYPNPAVDYIHLKFPSISQDRTAVIVDINGRLIGNSPATEKEAKLHVESLPRGIYLINITEKGTIVKTIKVSIE